MKLVLLAFCLTIVAGCSSSPTKRAGGFTSTVLGALKPSPKSETSRGGLASDGGETVVTLKAPQDPATPSAQTVERTDERNDIVLGVTERVTETKKPDGSVVTTTETVSPIPVTRSKTSQKTTTSIGTTREDTVGATTAKLNSFKGVQFLGVVLIVFALACFYPPVFAFVRSRTYQAAAGVAGIGLIILPSLVVGQEKELLKYGFFTILILFAWFYIQRHGMLQGIVDANKDGIDDRLQK